MLDRRFFECVSTSAQHGTVFEAYKAVYARSTMVLFSRKTRTPLAALTLKAEDVGCLSMLTGRPSPDGTTEPYFQGMVNMSNQVFDFTISNLTDKGMINFNILHAPHRVSSVNPGSFYGINEINELHTNESYTIEADQRNNRKMILKGKTQLVKDPKTGQDIQEVLTVNESEAIKKKNGLYFYLSVVPDKRCHEMVKKFSEGTIWKVTPGFVRQVMQQELRQDESYSFLSAAPMRRSVHLAGMISQARSPSEPPALVQPDIFGSPGPVSFDNYTSLSSAAFSTSAPPGPSSASRTAHSRVPFPRGYAAASLSGSADPNLLASSAFSSKILSHVGHREKHRKLAVDIDVGKTQAGELQYGSHVHVVSSETGCDYDYENCSEPTVLCMSIWTEMKFLPLPDIKEELDQEVQEWIQNKGKALVENLNAIYKSDKCVVDLESKADTIICTCGHQCVNHANTGKLRTCPLCRSPITAFVKAEGVE